MTKAFEASDHIAAAAIIYSKEIIQRRLKLPPELDNHPFVMQKMKLAECALRLMILVDLESKLQDWEIKWQDKWDFNAHEHYWIKQLAAHRKKQIVYTTKRASGEIIMPARFEDDEMQKE